MLEWAYACLERGLRIGVIGYQRGRTFEKNKKRDHGRCYLETAFAFLLSDLDRHFFSAVV